MVAQDVTAKPLSSCEIDTCWISESPYGYEPSIIANGIFVVIFTGSLVACLAYSIPGRKWLEFGIPVSLACIFEIIGYGVRIGSSFDPFDVRLYAVSTSFLTVAPSLVSAGIYFTVCQTVTILGVEHTLIDIDNYPRLVWIDCAGLVLQLVGIVVSFSDLSPATGLGPNAAKGSPIMALGTALQALSLVYFFMLLAVVLFRSSLAYRHYGYTTFHPEHGFVPLTRKFKVYVAMMIVAGLCLFGRAIFWATLLGDGLDGDIARSEALFAGFQGLLAAEAVVSLVLAHPASFLQDGMKYRRRNISTSPSAALLAPQYWNESSRRVPPPAVSPMPTTTSSFE